MKKYVVRRVAASTRVLRASDVFRGNGVDDDSHGGRASVIVRDVQVTA
jgi:hypothetical protein